MKRSGFKTKAPLTDAQKQLREAHREAKRALRSLNPGRKRINSGKKYFNGIRFDSAWERDVYIELLDKQNRKQIRDLDTHKVITFGIKNDAGLELKLQINIDFEYFDIRLGRWVRADAKPHKRLDSQKRDWFLRWKILNHIEPEFNYVLYRTHSWRDIDF